MGRSRNAPYRAFWAALVLALLAPSGAWAVTFVSISASESSVTEGQDVTFTLTRGGIGVSFESLNVTLNVMTSGDFDFVRKSGETTTALASSYTVDLDSTTASITFRATDPSNVTLDQDPGSITVAVESGLNYSVQSGSGTATVTINDDDDGPGLSMSDASAAEDDGEIAFTVALTGTTQSTRAMSVQYQTSATGTASADDFTATSGTLTFPSSSYADGQLTAGPRSRTIGVPVTDDALYEQDETFQLSLSNPSNLTFPNGATSLTATGTINDNEEISLTAAAGPRGPGWNSGAGCGIRTRNWG